MLRYLRKTPRHIILFLLMIGASLTLGLLSFSGMLLIWPVLSIAMISFLLATIYEGEIYWQNLKNVWKALFTPQALKTQLMREFLYETYQASIDTKEPPPLLIRHYLDLIQQYDDITQHQKQYRLKNDDHTYRKLLAKKIKRFERFFTEILFNTKEEIPVTLSEPLLATKTSMPQSAQEELCRWIKNHGKTYHQRYHQRYALLTISKLFSLSAGAVITVGTWFLLFEAFMSVPFLEFVPFIILPHLMIGLALISGIAYALITYNSILSMMNDRTVQNVYTSIKTDLKQEGLSWRNISKITMAFLLTLLAIGLTLCTAGTWWTIGQNLRFILSTTWLMVAALFIAIAEGVKVWFNAMCTWFNLREALSQSIHPTSDRIKIFFQATWQNFKKDIISQWYNPFWIILQIVILPLNFVCFLAHIISIGVTSDQAPYISPITSATIAATNEFVEDYHRFFGLHEHHHHTHDCLAILKERCESGGGHHHGLNLPIRLIQLLLTPLYILAILWDFAGQVCHKTSENLWTCLQNAVKRQYDIKPKQDYLALHVQNTTQEEHQVAQTCDALRIVFGLKDRMHTALRGKTVAKEKEQALEEYATQLQNNPNDWIAPPESLMQTCRQKRYNLFKASWKTTTTTEEALSKLPAQVLL